MPQVPTFCMFGTSAPMIMPSGIIASVPRASTHDDGQPAARAAGHEVVEEQEARDEDDQELRHDAEAVQEQVAGEVAAQAMRHRLVAQQRPVLALHRERVGRPDDDAEGDQAAEDARQGDRRDEQVGALDAVVAADHQVPQHRQRREEVEPLVLRAAQALHELRPAALEAEPDRVARRVHRIASTTGRSCACTRSM